MPPLGIEPMTCLFVAQCLNHYTTVRPILEEVFPPNPLNHPLHGLYIQSYDLMEQRHSDHQIIWFVQNQIQYSLFHGLLNSVTVFQTTYHKICRLDSFGYFPGVKFLLTDVSENSVVSIIKGANEDRG
jgi:hypothetical protein